MGSAPAPGALRGALASKIGDGEANGFQWKRTQQNKLPARLLNNTPDGTDVLGGTRYAKTADRRDALSYVATELIPVCFGSMACA
jgi:hypothetical protein